MGWRVAAAWALLGLASQCFLAAISKTDLVAGFERAMIHYLAWGAAGLLVGSVCEKIIEDAFRNRFSADPDDRSTALNTTKRMS